MMRSLSIVVIVGLLISFCAHAERQTREDNVLNKIISAYKLEPFVPEKKKFDAKQALGQALFFDPIMSGPLNTACATCHVRSKGSVDGLPMAVGVGSKGVGEQRLVVEDALIIPRNVLPFFNRGAKEFTALFWDGRVQVGPNGEFESPLGNHLPQGYENLLAVAATFPQAEPDEMLGRSPHRGGNQASTYHAELVGDQVDPDNFQERTLEVYQKLVDRVIGVASEPMPHQRIYRQLFNAAYPETEDYNIAHFGNALAAYISSAFELNPAPWDRYLQGDISALTYEQKQGAFIFFGRGRCAVCHTGTQFSDFNYHGLAVPQLDVGKHGGYLDYGRAKATGRAVDRFSFRTPPLRNVTKTGPWGHNGIFTSLEQAIEHHYNPVPLLYRAQQGRPREAQLSGRLLRYRSSTLAEMYPITQEDVGLLISFLKSLESDTVMTTEQALPASVPSGMNQFIVD
ncbi:methylamine utilization protein MauG [Stutzerimonas stutzeri]|nr:methylamine utilization protein MauG [Stutzerimonas stutzeri]